MLNRLEQQPADALLALIKLHNADPRSDKIDLGVGVYRTGQGDTPVFGAVKEAERRLCAEQDSKAYLGAEGDQGMVKGLLGYVLGDAAESIGGRIEGLQTPGGTGALQLGLGLAKRAGARRIVVGTPTWPNHPAIIDALDLEMAGFNHATADGEPDMDALRAAIADAGEDDVILLHACCHNPTGIDYSPAQWDEIAAMLAESPALAMIDMAYQGLGEGMDEDAYGTRAVLKAVSQAIVTYSCDKNFGVYRDRVGAIYAMTDDDETMERIVSNAAKLARVNWSQPPDHGGAVVRLVLEDEALTAQWLDELTQMRERIRQVRARLAEAGTAGSIDLTPLGQQNGLFATLPMTPEQVLAMREKHGVYMAGSGRLNVAGLTMGNIDRFIAALADVTG